MNASNNYAWQPTSDYVDHADVTRLARPHGINDLDDPHARSVADISWYWNAVVDPGRGITGPDWFPCGGLNIVDVCLTRWAGDVARRDEPAVVHENEAGARTTLTFAELTDHGTRGSAGLHRLGAGRGDAVAMAPSAQEAVRTCSSVKNVVVVGAPEPGEIARRDLLAAGSETVLAERMSTTDTVLFAHTSGTTGRPTGAVDTHAGFLVKTASEVAYSFDLGPAAGSAGSPTWAGSWACCPLWASRPTMGPWCSTRSHRACPTSTGCGAWSRRTP